MVLCFLTLERDVVADNHGWWLWFWLRLRAVRGTHGLRLTTGVPRRADLTFANCVVALVHFGWRFALRRTHILTDRAYFPWPCVATVDCVVRVDFADMIIARTTDVPAPANQR